MNTFNRLFIKHAQAVDGWGKPKKTELTMGHCAYWAYVFIKLYGGQACTLTTDVKRGKRCNSGHVIVFKDGLYFDGSHPEGVKSYKLLGKGRIIRHQSLKTFATYWYAFDSFYQNIPIFKIYEQVVKDIRRIG